MSFFFFKQKTAYEMRISDWSSDVCSSDLPGLIEQRLLARRKARPHGRDFRRAAAERRPRRIVIDVRPPIGRHPPPGLADLEKRLHPGRRRKADKRPVLVPQLFHSGAIGVRLLFPLRLPPGPWRPSPPGPPPSTHPDLGVRPVRGRHT